MSPQPSPGPGQHEGRIGQSLEATEDILSQTEPHSLLVNELIHICITSMKVTMMHYIEEAFAQGLPAKS